MTATRNTPEEPRDPRWQPPRRTWLTEDLPFARHAGTRHGLDD
ncbi:hypothetical protein [Salipiger sp.]